MIIHLTPVQNKLKLLKDERLQTEIKAGIVAIETAHSNRGVHVILKDVHDCGCVPHVM